MTQFNSEKWDEWMRQSLKGDKNAYRLLLCDLRIWLQAYFNKRAHPNEIEDLVQDTLLTIHNKRASYDPSRPFGPWLSAVAKHKWIDRIRKNIKFLEVELDDDLSLEDENNGLCAKHDVKKLLQLIPAKQAQIIEMVKLNEMSIGEVAQSLGQNETYIKVAVHRGLKLLQIKVMEGQND